MIFKQHIPNVVFDPRSDTKFEVEFDTKEELMDLEWVQRFSNSKYQSFHQFSLAPPMQRTEKNTHTLMQETEEGYKWWVVGHIFYPTKEFINSFPKWEPKRK